jgi:hypothetical protein
MEIGSLTKVFTALLIAEAVRRNELQLSSRIDELLFGQHWSGPGAISVEELATHTSGLPRVGLPHWKLFLADPYRSVSGDDLMVYLQRKRPRSPTKHKHLYICFGIGPRHAGLWGQRTKHGIVALGCVCALRRTGIDIRRSGGGGPKLSWRNRTRC